MSFGEPCRSSFGALRASSVNLRRLKKAEGSGLLSGAVKAKKGRQCRAPGRNRIVSPNTLNRPQAFLRGTPPLLPRSSHLLSAGTAVRWCRKRTHHRRCCGGGSDRAPGGGEEEGGGGGTRRLGLDQLDVLQQVGRSPCDLGRAWSAYPPKPNQGSVAAQRGGATAHRRVGAPAPLPLSCSQCQISPSQACTAHSIRPSTVENIPPCKLQLSHSRCTHNRKNGGRWRGGGGGTGDNRANGWVGRVKITKQMVGWVG